MSLQVKRIHGPELEPYLDALGNLRIRIFFDFPYLYEGSLEYERNYLKTYLQAHESHVTLVFDQQQLVGATTAIRAHLEEAAFQAPFLQFGFDPTTVCYFGESLLLHDYRGRGLGKLFMQDRLHFAQGFQEIKWASFCAVDRPKDHPLRPANYRPLDDFWRSQGFKPVSGMVTQYEWKDREESLASKKTLQYWMRPLP